MPKHTYNTHAHPLSLPPLPTSHRVNCPSVSAFWFLIFKYLPYAINSSSSSGEAWHTYIIALLPLMRLTLCQARTVRVCVSWSCVCVCTSRLRFFPAFRAQFFIENKFLTILFRLTENWQLPSVDRQGRVCAHKLRLRLQSKYANCFWFIQTRERAENLKVFDA